jgi:hypothetical protein
MGYAHHYSQLSFTHNLHSKDQWVPSSDTIPRSPSITFETDDVITTADLHAQQASLQQSKKHLHPSHRHQVCFVVCGVVLCVGVVVVCGVVWCCVVCGCGGVCVCVVLWCVVCGCGGVVE